MLSTPPGPPAPADQTSEAPRHVGDMLEVAPGRWAAATAIVAVERDYPPATSPGSGEPGYGTAATADRSIVSLILTRPLGASTPGADEGRLETVRWESPYPVEVLVETIAQLKQLRLTQLRETRETREPHVE